MLKQNFTKALIFSMISFFHFGCQKDISESATSMHLENLVKADNGNKIRLTLISSEFGTETFTYNENGLVHSWASSQIDLTSFHEYDENGRLGVAKVYADDLLVYTIIFFHDKNRVVRELWYQGNTQTIVDEVLYFFDNKGPTHAISPILDYRIDYEFTSQGNLLAWTLSVSGIKLVRGEYTYLNRLRNPTSAIPGLSYAYLYANSFFYANKWYSTSERFILFDEQGNIIVDLPQDPSKTIAIAGPQNYVAKSDFYDIFSDTFIHFTFSYENCGQCGDKNSATLSNSMRADVQKILLKTPKKKLSDQIVALKLKWNIK